MLPKGNRAFLNILLILLATVRASAQSGGPFDLSWNSIDGGGQTFSTGGPFSLGGTIGQCDAGTMSGGAFRLDGGFWGGTVTAGTGAPPATVLSALLRKTHGGGAGTDHIPVHVPGRVESQNVTSESRSGGVTELRIAFDVAPGVPVGDAVTIEEQVCAACPCAGSQAAYATYAGSASVAGSVQGHELALTFTPGLENGRTYRLTFSPELTSIPDQAIEVRALLGDVNGDGRVNATDRSLVVSAWTGPGNYSAPTDIDLSGRTNATDRSFVVSAWTGTERCAP